MSESSSPKRPIIGVMGAGEGASVRAIGLAQLLGELIAKQGWILLTGGRPSGVMEAAMRGAKRIEGSLTVGILPGDTGASSYVDIPIYTGMGNARNAINALSCDVLVAVGAGGAGTASEVAMSIKAGKPVILLAPTPEAEAFFGSLDSDLRVAPNVEEVVVIIKNLLGHG